MTFNKFSNIVYNKGRMKKIRSSILLLTLTSLLLTACDIEKRSFCLDSSSVMDYVEGKCAVVSPKDINQTIYIYCNQKNEKGDNFVITWSDVLSPKYFEFTGGLEGKKVDTAIFVGNNTLKVDFHGYCKDENATFGYLKANTIAVKTHTDDTKDANLYAYIAIGEKLGDIDKPADYTF